MIRFDDVHKTYKSKSGEVEALKGVSFDIDDGEFVFVIGKSGSGKSTLLKCITCEERPTEGSVTIDGFNISSMSRALVPYLRRQIGMIYQDFRLIETKTVFENVAFAGEIVGIPRQSLNQTVQLMLNVVGLKDKIHAYPQELSGGEQQRVAIARAMINNPRIIVADEPTGNLDPEISENIMALLQEINRNGSTVIVCTHDSNLVDRMKKRVIEISDGQIARDQEDSRYRGDAVTRTTPVEANVNKNPLGLSFGDDAAFEGDSDYRDNYDDDGYSSSQSFYFGETPELPKVKETEPEVEEVSAPSEVIEDVSTQDIPVIEELPLEFIAEEETNVVEDVKEEISSEAPSVIEEEIEEISIDDIDLDIQEDDD